MTNELDRLVQEYRSAQPFAPKLTFQQRCACYGMMKYRSVPRRIVSAAYSVSIRTLSKMIEPSSQFYQPVRAEAARLGMQEFCKRYITEHDEKLVAEAMRDTRSNRATAESKFHTNAILASIGYLSFIGIDGNPIIIDLGVVPIEITWPYRTWGWRHLNHPSLHYIGLWQCPTGEHHVFGRNAADCLKYIKGSIKNRDSAFYSDRPKEWVHQPNLEKIVEHQIEDAIQMICQEIQTEPNWEAIRDVSELLPESTDKLQARSWRTAADL